MNEDFHISESVQELPSGYGPSHDENLRKLYRWYQNNCVDSSWECKGHVIQLVTQAKGKIRSFGKFKKGNIGFFEISLQLISSASCSTMWVINNINCQWQWCRLILTDRSVWLIYMGYHFDWSAHTSIDVDLTLALTSNSVYVIETIDSVWKEKVIIF